MKKFVPIVIALSIALLAVTITNAQNQIENPNLPKSLVFQWKFKADQVNSKWKNDDFSVTRLSDGIQVFYGTYTSLEAALADADEIEKVATGDIELIPFFNQKSISAADALTLLSNYNQAEEKGEPISTEVHSYAIYFGTFDQIQDPDQMKDFGDEFCFTVNPNYTFSYAWGTFSSEEDAKVALDKTKALGFEGAEIQQYVNGQEIAMLEMHEIYAYAEFVKNE